MQQRTLKLNKYKRKVNEFMETNPNAKKLENHYKLMYAILKDIYPNSFEMISKETMLEVLYDVIYLDRYMRNKRVGYQNELKKELAKEFVQTL